MHAHQFWWACPLQFLRYCYSQKRPNFALGHGLYSPWSSKNLIDRNRLKKFMQVGIDVTCMHTNFGGHDLSGFRDTATLKNSQISLWGMDYSPWSSKNLIDRNQLKKFMQVGIDEMCMYTKFGGHGLSFRRFWSFFPCKLLSGEQER